MATAIQGTQTSPFSNKPPQTARKTVSVFQKSVSAISGAFITSLLVTPLDVVRVRLQSQQPTSSQIISNGATQPRLGYSTLGPDSRSGVTACCREVFFSRSWNGNGNGNVAQCTHVSFETPVVESAYCAAEETGKKTFRGTWEGLVKIARYEGITSLWRGLSPTLYYCKHFDSN
jgi:solute carrier family 25 protein 39/40